MTCICRPLERNPYCRACAPGGVGLIDPINDALDAIVDRDLHRYGRPTPGPLYDAVRDLLSLVLNQEDALYSNRVFSLATVVRGVAPPRCFPKEPHASQGAALAQLRSLLNRGLEKDIRRIHVYRCPDCRQWHVGHGRPA